MSLWVQSLGWEVVLHHEAIPDSNTKQTKPPSFKYLNVLMYLRLSQVTLGFYNINSGPLLCALLFFLCFLQSELGSPLASVASTLSRRGLK